MQIKVFRAGNMKDAMTAMKAELGDDAVILHSKKYREGGLLGIGSREVVEITAAVEESSMPRRSGGSRITYPSTSESITETPIDNEPIEIDEQSQSSDEEPQLPIEELQSPIEKLQSPDEEAQSPDEEAQSPDEEAQSSIEESQPPIEESQPPIEEPQPPVEEPQPPVEEPQPPIEESQPPIEQSQPPIEQSQPPIEQSQPVREAPAQNSSLMQEQMAQTQAMIMAQINQMQMMQQAAFAQAQAQAQAAEQIRLQQAQAEQMRLQQVQAEQLRLQQAEQVQQNQLAQAHSPNEEKIKRLESEILQMKALLAEVLGRGPQKGTLTLHEAMKLQEFDEDTLADMATLSKAGDTLIEVHAPAARATLVNFLNEKLNFAEGIKLNRHGVRIVALLGTTGVGKTTTLAKIAAKFVLEHHINVALITADTYRISAVEQLKTYSDILELPLDIVYNPTELNAAIERYRDKDLIIIDTAGRSQHNDYQMRELEDFLRVNPRIEKHLVMSATTKLTDARQIMNKFSSVNPDRIIFTKTDETSSLGMIVNLLRDSKCAISYITVGQNVPDDIERANSEILANMLLRKVDAL